jgi:hypothetical protein
MRITELIKKLEQIRTTAGDLSVLLPYGEFGFEDLTEAAVEEVYFDAFEGSTSGVHCRTSEAETYGSEFRSTPVPGKAVILDTARAPLKRAG